MLKLWLLLLTHLMMLLLQMMLLRLKQMLLLLLMMRRWRNILIAIVIMVRSQRILRLLLEELLFENLLLLAIVRPLLLLLLGLAIHRRIPGGHRCPVVLGLHGKGNLLLWRGAAYDGVLCTAVLRWLLQGRTKHLLTRSHHQAAASYHSRADRYANTTAAAGGRRFPRLPSAFATAAFGKALLLIVLSLHGAVPVVLNSVVRPPGDELGDLCPLVAPLLVCVVDDAVLKYPCLECNGNCILLKFVFY
jgi:hypothetical protein